MRSLVKLVALIFIGFVGACNLAKDDSKTLAIVSKDGLHAVSLIPLRNLYVPGEGVLFDDEAARVENALRMQYAVVECTGADAGPRLNFIETLASGTSDTVRRDGRRLVAVTTEGYREFEGCAIKGRYTAGPASMVGIFGAPPKTQAEFDAQQSIWLAMRGRGRMGTKTFGVAFYRFLGESMGALPKKSYADISESIQLMDMLYNPCIKQQPKTRVFDKYAQYLCDKNANYEVKGDYATVATAVTARVDAAESAFASSLAAMNGDDAIRVAGLALAYDAEASIAKDLKLSSTRSTGAEKLGTPKSADEGEHPVVKLLRPKAASFQHVFRVQMGSALAPVVSFSNPRQIDTPPVLSKTAKVGSIKGLGLTASSANWTAVKSRDNYFAAQVADIGGAPAFKTARLTRNSIGRMQTSATTWIYLGRAATGEHMWKRANDPAIYYSDAQGNVTRITNNATGNVALQPLPAGLPMPQGGGAAGGSATDWNKLTVPGPTLLGGGGTSSTPPVTPSLPGPSLPGPSLPGPSLPGPSNPGPVIPAPVNPLPTIPTPVQPVPSQNDILRDQYKDKIGWDTASLGGMEVRDYVGQKGNTLPNFGQFTSGAFQVDYTNNKGDQRGKGDFNCQNFTAADIQSYHELTGLNARALGVSYTKPNGESVGHSIGAFPVGTDNDGNTLYKFKEAQWGPGGSNESKPFKWGDAGSAYAEWSGKKDVKTTGHLEYDPKKGLASVMWDNEGDRVKSNGTAKTRTGDDLTTKGKTNWGMVPEPKNPDRDKKKIEDEAEREREDLGIDKPKDGGVGDDGDDDSLGSTDTPKDEGETEGTVADDGDDTVDDPGEGDGTVSDDNVLANNDATTTTDTSTELESTVTSPEGDQFGGTETTMVNTEPAELLGGGYDWNQMAPGVGDTGGSGDTGGAGLPEPTLPQPELPQPELPLPAPAPAPELGG